MDMDRSRIFSRARRAPVKPLSTLSHGSLVSMLASTAARPLSAADEGLVRGYLSKAPPKVRGRLLDAVLQDRVVADLKVELAVRLLLCQGVASLNVRRIRLEDVQDEVVGRVMRCLRDHGAALRQLDLHLMELDNVTAFMDVLPALPLLEDVRVSVVPVTDDLLAAFVQHCPALRSLQVSEARMLWLDRERRLRTASAGGVTRRGLEALRHATNLEELRVHGLDKLSLEDRVFLLRAVPSLRSLGGNFGVLQALQAVPRDAAGIRLTKVTDCSATACALDAALRLCPDLHSVDLSEPKAGAVRRLAAFPKLTSIALRNMTDTEELYALLAAVGTRVTHLVVDNDDGSDDYGVLLDLRRVARLCPSLEVFEASYMSYRPSGPIAWPSLRSLTMRESKYGSGTQALLDAVRDVIRKAPALRRLSVGVVWGEEVRDDVVHKMCGPQLEEVHLRARGDEFWAEITEEGVLTFIARCPRLKRLAGLGSCLVGMEEENLDELRDLCRAHNLDLTLDWDTDG